MSRIEQTFKNLTRTALISYTAANDPDYETSLNIMKALPGAGVDIIEIGMPFTDPVAEGPVIQRAHIRSLKSSGSMKQTLQMIRDFRKDNDTTPIILMGYMNPIIAYGLENFVKDTAEASVDGFIIVDLPPEESEEFHTHTQKYNLDIIRLITPTTDEKRLPKILHDASGFLYYVAITGITGTKQGDPAKIKTHIDEIRKSTDLPIAIGFGIKTPDDAAQMAKIADAVIVGSSIVQTIETEVKAGDPDPVITQVKALAGAL